ncbi:MAG: CapA family protein [Nitrosomonadaceae bacterium]|nr:CapA family protein [Nitrosomonadaceae bacterium]
MKRQEKHADRQLQRREFIGYLLAAGCTLAVRPVCAQAVMAGSAGSPAKADAQQAGGVITLFVCGDVMTGRGVDQVLPHPGNPVLYEPYMKSATGYVQIAEEANGPIPKPVDYSYIWGDALAELARVKPDARIINLETSVTQSDEAESKSINYRMHPANIPCITAAHIDCCTLANNHVLDWGRPGLAETLQTLKTAGIKTAGAGQNLREAAAPAVIPVAGKGRVLVFSFGSESSGIPRSWAAKAGRPGVNRLPDFSAETVWGIREGIGQVKLPGDIAVASIHWGGNWGYPVPHEQQEFARQLIDEAGVDVVHGHSSHHVQGIEVYQGKPILYGCGDFLNDYEGISGHEAYRGDLALMYFVSMDSASGNLLRLQMTPMQIKHFRLNRASRSDTLWLNDVLNREGRKFGTGVELNADNSLALRWTPLI